MVLAEVVSVALELSSDEVVLRSSPGLLADSGKCNKFPLDSAFCLLLIMQVTSVHSSLAYY